MSLSAARIARGLCCPLCRCAVQCSACKKTTVRLTFFRPAPRVTHCYWISGKCRNVRRPYLTGLPTAIATVTLVKRKSRVYGFRTAILSKQCGHLTAMRVCVTVMTLTLLLYLELVSVPLNPDSLSLCHENEKLSTCCICFMLRALTTCTIFLIKDQQMHLDV